MSPVAPTRGIPALRALSHAASPRLRSGLHLMSAPSLRWERPASIPRGAEKVAVFAQFSVSGRMSRSVSEFARQLHEHGYHVVLSSSALAPGELEWPHGLPDIGVLRKPNLGYDFGSWAVALAEVPEILTARRVLFVNDSFAGPFWPITPILADFERSSADVWGLARSMEFEPHLQSYFFGMRGETLRSAPTRRFWGSVGIRSGREDVVQQYEIGLTRMLHRHSFSVHAMFDCEAVTPGGGNPSLFGWHEFLRAGVPFVKRQLLRDSRIGWQAGTIRDILASEYGVEIDEWLSDEERG